jgi:hypothetical protein
MHQREYFLVPETDTCYMGQSHIHPPNRSESFGSDYVCERPEGAQEMMEDHSDKSRLFLLRLWQLDDRSTGEEGATPVHRWAGKLQLVGREAHAFTGWDDMIERLEAMLSQSSADRARNPQA